MDTREKRKIAQIEEQIIGEKPWQLKGEVSGNSRPLNSLLFEDVNFEQRIKAPKITPESTEALEDLIKQRIKDNKFDDPIRKVKPANLTSARQVDVSSEKSKVGLAQLYENELVTKATTSQAKDGPEKKAEIKLNALLKKLDVLTYSLTILVILSLFLERSDAYITTLDAHSEECFFEKALASTKLGFTFEVIEGGFLDIDVSIFDPDGNMIHQEPKASSGKYTIEANKEGSYKYCFSNKMSTVTPKVVMFSIETAKQVQHKLSGAQDQEKLNEMIKSLTQSMTSVKHELEYLSVRDRIHRQINDSTNSRVVVWTWVEFFVLLGVSLGQVVYLKRFFEVRRVI